MSYIYLGSIKRGIDRGALLNRAIERLDKIPSQNRREAILDRLKVAEVVEMMGLMDVVESVFLLNKTLCDQNPEKAGSALMTSLVDMIGQKFPDAIRQVPTPAFLQAASFPDPQPAPSVRTETPQPKSGLNSVEGELLARPVAPVAAAIEHTEKPVPEPELSAAMAAGKGRSPLGGMMQLK